MNDEDDEDYFYSNDTSFTFDDNSDYNENVDIDSQFEMAKNYYELTEGITIQNTSSDDSSLSGNFQS
jgi:hypothetical protein